MNSVVELYCQDPEAKSRLHELKKRWGFPVASSSFLGDRARLNVERNKLSLQIPSKQKWTPFFVDFLSSKTQFQLKTTSKKSLLAKAVGLPKSKNPKILDLTFGFGSDAIVLAHLGAEVFGVEKDPVVFELVQDGLRRAETAHNDRSSIENIGVTCANALDFLANVELASRPDVIYLDPMFPHEGKSARSQKEMQVLQFLLDQDPIEEKQVLKKALETGVPRVVVKRSRKAPAIQEGVHHSFEGRRVRFDLYLNQ